MKKIGIALALTFIALTSLPAFAAVDVPVFDDTFVRGTGTPVIETRAFTGIVSGPATIKLWNGGAADSTTERVSSTEVRVNGTLIFGPHNFNQNVTSLEATIDLIQGENNLEVLLKSKPGGRVDIEITQPVQADGAAFIGGSQGRVVEVTEPSSPILGTLILAPELSLPLPTLVTITYDPTPPPHPDNLAPASPSVDIISQYPLQGYVMIKIPVQTPPDETYFPVAKYYNENTSNWEWIPSNFNFENNYIIILTDHLTKIRSYFEKLPDYSRSLSVGFDNKKDSMRYENIAPNCPGGVLSQLGTHFGVCQGMAGWTSWYFNDRGHNLFCKYTEAESEELSCWLQLKEMLNIQSLFELARMTNPISWAEEWLLPDNDLFKEILTALDQGKTTRIALEGVSLDFPYIYSHAVVVAAWNSYADTEPPNDPERPSDAIGHFDVLNGNHNDSNLDKVEKMYVTIEEVDLVLGKTYSAARFHYKSKELNVSVIQVLPNPISSNLKREIREKYNNYESIHSYIDSDGDTVPDKCRECSYDMACDNCPQIANLVQTDSDGDSVGDACDVCPGTPTAEYVDERGCSASQRDVDGDGSEGIFGTGADCDDNNSSVYPGRPEVCGDNIDQDCDGADLECPLDTDGDGIPDATDDDDDNDGMPDVWENTYGLNSLLYDRNDDFDNDGYSNFEEYEGNSAPNDPTSIPGIDLNRGLVAYYPFNGNANDESENLHNGVEYGGLTYVNGVFGQAASFDGVNDCIVVYDNPQLRLFDSDITLSVWVNETSRDVSYADAILFKRNLSQKRGWGLSITGSINAAGEGKVGYSNTGGYEPAAISVKSIPLGNFHHVLVVYKKYSETAAIYIDGVFDSEMTGILPPSPEEDSDLYIGRDSSISQYYFQGLVDEIRIYNRALSEPEIQALYDMDKPVDLNAGLIAYYPFNGNANDASGNENHGVEYGGVSYAGGAFGQAASFDGVSGRIKLPNNVIAGDTLTTN